MREPGLVPGRAPDRRLLAAALFALRLTSPITPDDRAAVRLAGVAAGLTILLEELGWTGFAVPRLRRRYGVLTTGLIEGVLWAAWHFLQQLWIGGTYAGDSPWPSTCRCPSSAPPWRS
jgi:membrane protease YdiL (CAAX protease family)